MKGEPVTKCHEFNRLIRTVNFNPTAFPTLLQPNRVRQSDKVRGNATSVVYSIICENWRELRNAEWRPRARFFKSLLITDQASPLHLASLFPVRRTELQQEMISANDLHGFDPECGKRGENMDCMRRAPSVLAQLFFCINILIPAKKRGGEAICPLPWRNAW